ncbi:MAG: glyoxylase-like metal-dependent hydrolase (beta-lactamase superfamily II) [Cellvibrionaceae bacterium]|jgi:glyoxylase-like metal-dependent hydrolase (beta-lactamase superfamily II)
MGLLSKIITVHISAFAIGILFSSSLLAKDESESVLSIKLTDSIYVITGKGGNIGVSIGEDGTFLIDDKFAPMTQIILDKIKAIGGKPPKFVINTHWHGDHTGGNENLGKKGSVIVAHDNVRKRLSVDNEIAAFNMKSKAYSKAGLPSITFAQGMTFHLNKDTVELTHLPKAHTDGDSVIYFKQANILHAGDTFFNGFYPFIDIDHGGSLKGMLGAADSLLKMVDDSTHIIPGHGPMAKKADLTAYRNMLKVAYKELSTLKKQGKSVEQAIAANPLKSLDTEWSDGLFKTDKWIGLVYGGLD